MAESILYDLRITVRGLLAQPTFTGVTVLVLALGLGACLAVAGLAQVVLARKLPAAEPERLVALYQTRQGSGAHPMSQPDYLDLREQTTAFESLASHYSTAPFNASVGDRAAVLEGSVVSENFFETLGIVPAIGGFFEPDATGSSDRGAACVISSRLWQRWFEGDTSVLGRSLLVNGTDFTIVGVAPESFWGALVGSTNDVWIPSRMSRVGYRFCDALSRDCTYLNVVGRLRDGVTLASVRAEVAVVARRLAEAYPDSHRSLGVLAVEARGMRPAEAASSSRLLGVLSAIVAVLVLAAFANLAGMLLARNLGRRREVALRLALGASRGRIVQRLLLETFVLALAGSAAGLLVGAWAQSLLLRYLALDAAWGADGFEGPVVLSALGLALAAGLLIGLWPSIEMSRVALAPSLKEGAARVGSARSGSDLRAALVVAQVGACLVLIVGAARLAASVGSVVEAPPYRSREVLSLRLRPRLSDYDAARAERFHRDVLLQLRSVPGVASAALGLGQPYSFHLPETKVSTTSDALSTLDVPSDAVTPGYFETIGLPLLQGRELLDSDRDGVVLNRALAGRLFGHGEAVGENLLIDGASFRVVGVVADAQPKSLAEPQGLYFYGSYWRHGAVDARMVLRFGEAGGDVPSRVEAILAAIGAVDPSVPVTEVAMLEEKLDERFRPLELASVASAAAGVTVALLTAIGLYGLVAFTVGQRSREIGIRRALGARNSDISRLVTAEGLRLALFGIGLGLAASVLLSPFIRSFLYGAGDGALLLTAGATLMLAALVAVATLVPSRRALAIEPTRALRED